jgi:23S rRNA (uracil1939-C5)-methyltransferase
MTKMFNINDIVEFKIIDINNEGKGVGKLDNFVIFTDKAVTGDLVKAQILEQKKNFAVARTIEVLQSSPYRVKPECKYFENCGACQLLDLSYQEQLKFKKNTVINTLKKASINMDEIETYDTIGMENPFRYRNKTAFSVSKDNSNKIKIGTYEQSSHKLVNLDKCLIQSELADSILKNTREVFEKHRINPYNKKTQDGTVRHIVIRTNKDNEAMLIIVTNTEGLPNADEIVNDLVKAESRIKTIVQNINNKRTSEILGYKNKTIYGTGTIVDYICDLKIIISPHTFFQINSIQAEKLYEKAIEFAQLGKDDICLDLYCGIGTISLLAAKKAKKVYGIEQIEQAIKDAKLNAISNKMDNVEFVSGKVENILPTLHKQDIKADVIILDPPRKGCEPEVLKAIKDIAPKRVVYVSCNPATLSRDLKILQEDGFNIDKIQPVDMFCNSVHVESIILMTYCGSKEK